MTEKLHIKKLKRKKEFLIEASILAVVYSAN